MSIKKVSDLDSYLSAGTTGNTREEFQLSTFKDSLFEISKKKADEESNPNRYSSRNINGDTLISAMRAGLSAYFADVSDLSAWSSKLAKVLNCFDDDVTIFNINNISCTNLSVTNTIEGVAKWG